MVHLPYYRHPISRNSHSKKSPGLLVATSLTATQINQKPSAATEHQGTLIEREEEEEAEEEKKRMTTTTSKTEMERKGTN